MNWLAQRAALYRATRIPVTYDVASVRRFAAHLAALLIFTVCLVMVAVDLAFAQTAPATPVGDGATGGLISLWGPALGVLGAFVLFFDRLAKVIPNSTTNSVLKLLLTVSTVLGVKVEDKK